MNGLNEAQKEILIILLLAAVVLILTCFVSYCVWKNCCEKEILTNSSRQQTPSNINEFSTCPSAPTLQSLQDLNESLNTSAGSQNTTVSTINENPSQERLLLNPGEERPPTYDELMRQRSFRENVPDSS